MVFSRANFWLLLVAVVASGVALRLLHMAPAMGSDDQRWILTARHFAGTGGTPDLSPVYFTRAVFLALLALWGKIATISIPGVVPLMLLIGALTTILVGLGGRAAFDPTTGLLAAGLYAVHPLNVAYDPYVGPDGLATCLQAAFLLTVILHLKGRRLWPLVCAGIAGGLMFGTKNYYALAGVPVGLLLLFESRTAWDLRLRRAACLLGSAMVGLAISFVLQAMSNGDPLAELHASAGYADVLLGWGDPAAGKTGFAALVYIVLSRLEYVKDLFFGTAGLLGWLLLGGALWGVMQARRQAIEFILISIAAVYLLFLAFMPVRFSPLVLVEMQTRYLVVLLPSLTLLAAAWATRVYADMQDGLVRRAARAVLVVGLAWCAWIPSGWWDRYGVLEAMGIREATRVTAADGGGELLVASRWHEQFPEELVAAGVTLRYADFQKDGAAQRITMWLRERPDRRVFLVRTPLRSLRAAIAKGDNVAALEYGAAAPISSALETGGFPVQRVYVPEDTFRVWLDRVGIGGRGQLVGWLYRVR